jgi:hypothetical protein
MVIMCIGMVLVPMPFFRNTRTHIGSDNDRLCVMHARMNEA